MMRDRSVKDIANALEAVAIAVKEKKDPIKVAVEAVNSCLPAPIERINIFGV